MSCYHPLTGFQSPPTGLDKSPVFFSRPDGPRGFALRTIKLPCGRCIGCRLERSRQWAMRCVHESQLHEDNCFITLTYNDEHLPYGGTLIKKHFQGFMKRLRRKYAPLKISFFHCGEYGEKNRRPHYHALLFGLRFHDLVPFTKSANRSVVYTSKSLSDLWAKGHCTVGELTFESAAYCARYAMKKITGPLAHNYYQTVDQETGEITQLQPEYITMSLKPAIGKDWYEEFSRDVYPDDFVVLRARRMKPPKYYDKLHEFGDPVAHLTVKEIRDNYARSQAENSTPARLAIREEITVAKIASLKRSLE